MSQCELIDVGKAFVRGQLVVNALQNVSLTIEAGALAAFAEQFERAVLELADEGCFAPAIDTDGELAQHELTLDAVELIDQQIWGQGFAAPTFTGEFEVVSQRLIREAHLKADLRAGRLRLTGIAFGRREPLPARSRLVYRLARDDWQGLSRVSLHIEHVLDA